MSIEYRGVIPHLIVKGASDAIDFYAKALGAEEIARHPADDGTRLIHAEIRVAGAPIFLCDDFPEYCGGKSKFPGAIGGTPVVFHLNVPNCDAAMKRATDAGATVIMPASDAFWGARYGQVRDPFGHEWSFSHPLTKPA